MNRWQLLFKVKCIYSDQNYSTNIVVLIFNSYALWLAWLKIKFGGKIPHNYVRMGKKLHIQYFKVWFIHVNSQKHKIIRVRKYSHATSFLCWRKKVFFFYLLQKKIFLYALKQTVEKNLIYRHTSSPFLHDYLKCLKKNLILSLYL